MRDLGKILYAQPTGKMAPSIGKYGLNTVGFRFEFEEGGELRLTAGTTMVEHKLACDNARRFEAEVLLDQRKREVDAGSHAGRSPHRSVSDEDSVFFDPHIGIAGPK